MIILLWIILGLTINYLTNGLPFTTAICLAAALLIILPALLKINLYEIKLILKNKKIFIFVSIIINFLIWPAVAFILRWLIFRGNNPEFLLWLLILSIIPWGGLLTSYMKLAKADLNLWLTIFTLNLLIFWFIFIPFNVWIEYLYKNYFKSLSINSLSWSQQTNPFNQHFYSLPTLLNKEFQNSLQTQQNQPHCIVEETTEKIGLGSLYSCFSESGKINPLIWIYGFFILILIPVFILTILKLTKLENKFKKYSPIIGKIWTLAIITYIFSIKDLRTLLNTDIKVILWKLIILVASFYIIIYLGAWIISSLLTKNKRKKFALFWNLSTRFITLGLIIWTIYAYYLNDYKITAVFLISYFVQIGLAVFIVKLSKKHFSII